MAGDDFFHGAGHAAQVGAFHVGVNVDHRLHIVMADRALLGAGDDGGNITQHLYRFGDARCSRRGAGSLGGGDAAERRSAGRASRSAGGRFGHSRVGCRTGDGQTFECSHRVELVLRSLDRDIVGNPVARIEIEIGARLETAAERDQEALCDILLRKARARGARAVHVHRQVRFVERLLDARVGRAANIADFVEHVFGQGAIGIEIGADDLNVNGRGKPEIQNLGDDVDWHHIKRDARVIAGQHLAQTLNVHLAGMVIACQLHLYVGVRRAHRRRGGVGKVERRVRQADVVEDRNELIGRNFLADGRLDVVAESSSLLDASAGVRAHVNHELAGVNGREEVLPEERRQSQREEGKRKKEDQEGAGVIDAQSEQAQVAATKPVEGMFESVLKPRERVAAGLFSRCLRVVVLLQQVLGHGGHKRARQEVAGEHGKDHSLGHGNKQVARHATQEEHGHENDADGECGDECGRGDLRGAFKDGLLQLASRLQKAVDVLDGDGGIVHQDAHGQRHAAQSHNVDGFVQRVEHDEGAENRKRNGDGDDDRRPPTAQENQNHCCGQAGGDDCLAHHAADRAADKDRLIGESDDFQLRWQLALQTRAGDDCVHVPDDVQGRRRAGLHDVHHDGAAAVDPDNVGLWRTAVAHVGHIADIDHRPVHCLYGHVVQSIENRGRGVGLHLVLKAIELDGAGRSDYILRGDGVDHVDGR